MRQTRFALMGRKLDVMQVLRCFFFFLLVRGKEKERRKQDKRRRASSRTTEVRQVGG